MPRATPLSGSVLFVGSAVHDTIAVVDELPGPDDRVEADAIVRSGGGPAATAAVAAARMGVAVELATAVGDDDLGREVLSALEAAGVGLRHAEIRQGETTAQSVAVVSRTGNARCLMVRPGPALGGLPGGYDWVHADQAGYPVVGPARDRFGCLSIDDGNHITGLDLSVVDLYAPTLQSLRARTGTSTATSALAVAHARGATLTVATDGGDGAVVYDGAQPLHVPALAVEPLVSTLGAGDVFHGALLAGLILGRGLEEAARLAAVCAALACRAIDGRGSLPDLAEAEAHLDLLGASAPLAPAAALPLF
ncbi:MULTISPECIES: carbohydrate kinase family protein [Pseudonocardia]|uniref:Ribokinase n=2 Tax=Pseudonocardia TaxID=1847 RepID=A0ABQ0S8U4_9PSEU|nr:MULTISPECIES: carbohydrate kinase family protein [Pseudonocardia]OSY34820.1 putative sugar kinase YdjH [Pseudonocardia autotrophica]TDN73023.1 sulfofructose kinase [Pseudonocardia autotrophica]BBG03742.1 ribokinase [Pseudonocardia autotrophica]GEC29281.1 ribokinase [Pseudonocardia saturnea]